MELISSKAIGDTVLSTGVAGVTGISSGLLTVGGLALAGGIQ